MNNGENNSTQKQSQQNTGEVMLGCLFLIIIIGFVVTVLYLFATSIFDGESNLNYDEKDYEYIEESDDKDSDGDVDYDDVEKYLNESLENDINDGDDW